MLTIDIQTVITVIAMVIAIGVSCGIFQSRQSSFTERLERAEQDTNQLRDGLTQWKLESVTASTRQETMIGEMHRDLEELKRVAYASASKDDLKEAVSQIKATVTEVRVELQKRMDTLDTRIDSAGTLK